MQRYKALLKILDSGSFTRAAEELGYSQSAVSKMITSLEAELGVKLIQRSRYGIRLTPEGEDLLPYIRNTQAQQELLETAAADLQGLAAGEIRIGAFASISKDWLAPIMEAFWRDYPGIRFELMQGDYSTISDLVRSGHLDIGFVNMESTAGLSATPLKSDELLLVLPQNHPLAQKERISLSEIRNERFFMIRSGEQSAYNDVAEAFRKEGVVPHIVLRAYDDYTILSLVERGCGVSILSEKIIRDASFRVVARPLARPVMRDICIITRSDRTVPVACRRFIRFLLDRRDTLT